MKRITAQQAATAWGVSVQMVRRYCKDGKVHGALETAQGWMIPEGALRPGTQTTREFYQTPLVKKFSISMPGIITSESMSTSRRTWPTAPAEWPVTVSPASRWRRFTAHGK